jgi:hypothetical protein
MPRFFTNANYAAAADAYYNNVYSTATSNVYTTATTATESGIYWGTGTGFATVRVQEILYRSIYTEAYRMRIGARTSLSARPTPPSQAIEGGVSVRDEPMDRALALLRGQLSPEQLAEFTDRRQFTVRSRTGRVYRVGWGNVRNIHEIGPTAPPRTGDGAPILGFFCIHPNISCPIPDVMLAQKLLIEANEEEFLRVANRTELNLDQIRV